MYTVVLEKMKSDHQEKPIKNLTGSKAKLPGPTTQLYRGVILKAELP